MGNGEGRANAGLIGLLLISCGLDALGKGGPIGRTIAAGAGCCVFVVGLVVMIVVLVGAANDTTGTLSPSTPPPPPPPPAGSYMQGREVPHTPTDTSYTEGWWLSFFIIVIAITLLSTPMFYYVPQYVYRRGPVVEPPAPARSDERPLLALSKGGAPEDASKTQV